MNAPTDFKPRARVNNSLVQPLERPLLAWLASRLPQWVTSDRLTCFGILGSFVSFVSYGLSNYHPGFFFLASVGIIMNWFGDSLDGTIARYRKRERPRYGFFVDHTVDTYNELFIILGLGMTVFFRFEVACLIFIIYLMITVFTFVRANVTQTLQITAGLLGATELRMLVIVLNAVMFFTTPWTLVTLWAPLTMFDVGGLIGFGVGVVGLAIAIFVESRRLGREDPPRQ